MVMKKRLKRYTALLLAASMVLSSSGMTTLGTEIGSSVESSDTESSGDSGSTQGSSSEEGGSSDSASEGGSSSHEQSGGESGSEGESASEGSETGSESGNNEGSENEGGNENPEGEGSGSEGSGSDNESDSESGKTETDDDSDGNTSDSKDPEESDDGNSNTSDSEDSEDGDNDSQTSDNKEEESGEGSHGGNGGGGSAGGGSGSGGNIGSGEIQGKPDADEPKAEDELIADEEDKKDEDDKDNEDEINDYILEAIVFPEQERAAESIRKSAMRSARMLANTLNSDETSEDNEDEIGENGSDIADSSSSNYIERQVDVGDTVDDLKLPKEIILKVRPVEDEDDADAETEGETDSGSDMASKSDAKKAGTDKNGSDTAETKGNEDNDSAEKDNKDEKDLEEIRIRLEEEDWMIASPMEFAGDDLGSFNTDGIELLDEDGELTGEYSEEYAQYPQYILVPNFDNLDIESEEGISLNMVDMLDEDESSTIEDYLMKNVAVMARVGETREGDIIDGVVQVPLNLLGQQTETSEYYEYDGENAKLILKTGTENATKYRLYIAERTGGNTDIPTISIEFDSSLANKDIEITIDGDSNPGKTIEIGDSEFDHPTIDLSEIKSLNLSITGNVVIKGGYETATIRVPEAKSLSIGGTGNLTVSSDEESVAIGTKVDGQLMGTVNITGGNITINADAQGVGVGSYSATGTGGRLNVTGGSVSIGGGRYRNSEDLFPLQNITLNVTDKAGRFFVHSNNVNANDGLLKITEGQTYLRGAMKDKVGSSGLVIDVTGTEDINPNWSDRIELGDGDQGFMLRVPNADTYTLSGEETSEGVQRTFGYIGDLDGISSGDFKVGSDKTVTYKNVRKVYLPVFWDSSAVITGTMTAEGYLNVKLSAAVDIRNERSNTPGTTIYDAGTEDKQKYGFLIYQLGKDNERINKNYIEILESELQGGEGNSDSEGISVDSSERGAAYEITISQNDGENRLTPGETYYVVPYVRTNAGYREAEEIKYGGLDENGEYDPTDPIITEEDPVIVLKMPKIEFPEKIEFTYGTMTGDALDKQEFHNLAEGNGVSYPADGKSVVIDGVTLTFTTPKTADNAIWGTNIENASFRLNKTTEGENDGWGNVTITVPTNSDGTAAEGYTYPNGTFVVEFIAPENTGEDEHNQVVYENIIKSVDVTVKPKQLSITRISDGSETKVYDKNTNVIWKVPASPTAVTLSGKVTPYIYPGTPNEEDDVYVDISNYNDAKYDSSDAGDRKITFIQPVLGGEDKVNYVLPEKATVDGKITGKDITVKPVNYTKKTGERYTVNRNYEIEVVNSEESGVSVEDLTLDNDYFVINDGTPTNDKPGKYSFTLDEQKFSDANKNYEITYVKGGPDGAIYTIEQDKPVLDEDGTSTEDGAYVINPDENTLGQNGWYKDKVVIAPKIDLGDNKTNYYDKIRNNTSGEDSDKTPEYKENLTFTGTQKDVKIQLNNSTTGAYTSVDTERNYYVDSDDPAIKTSGIKYEYTNEEGGESPLDTALHLLGFGNFFNKELTVTVPATDGISGVWYIEVTKTPENGTGTETPTTERYYFNESNTEADPTAYVPEKDNVTEEDKKASVSFRIANDFNGIIEIKVVDYAGQESDSSYLGNDEANGKWIITQTPPTVDEIVLSGSNNNETRENKWFNGEYTSVDMRPKATSTVSDSSDTGIQKIEIWVDNVKLDDDIISGEEGSFNEVLTDSYDAVYELMNQTGEGTIKIVAYNNAGNKAEEEVTYKFDSVDPYVDTERAITYYKNDGTIFDAVSNFFEFGHFFKEELEVRIPVDDATSGVKNIHYGIVGNINDNNLTSTANVQSGKDGQYCEITLPLNNTNGYVRYYVEDVAGNKSETKVLGIEGGKVWIIEDEAPLVKVEYQDDSGTVLTPKTVGGVEWFDKEVNISAKVTEQPEKTGFTGLNTVTYNLAEGSSQPANIVLGKGNADDTPKADWSENNLVDTEGKDIEIYLWAKDNAGNESEPYNKKINVDLSAPVISDVTVDEHTSWSNEPITVSFKVKDEFSGIKDVSLERYLDGKGQPVDPAESVELTQEGDTYTAEISKNGTYRIVAKDKLDHERSYDDSKLVIKELDYNDPVEDTLKIAPKAGQAQNSEGIYTGDEITLVVTAEDTPETVDYGESGIASFEIYNNSKSPDNLLKSNIQWDTLTEEGDNKELTLPLGTGTYKLLIVIRDNAGNEIEKLMTDSFKVSNTTPNIRAEILDNDIAAEDIAAGGNTWLSRDSVSIKFTVEPREGVVVEISTTGEEGPYSSDFGGLTNNNDGTFTFKATEAGTHNIWVRANNTTAANKYSNVLSYTIKLDRSKPGEPTIKIGDANKDDWYNRTDNSDIVITPPAREPESDTAEEKTYYKLFVKGSDASTAEEKEYTVPVTGVKDGEWTIVSYTKDTAGNTSEEAERDFKIDNQNPSVSKIEVSEAGESIWSRIPILGQWFVNDNLIVKVTVGDATSGADKLEYWIKGETDTTENYDSSGVTIEGGDQPGQKIFSFEVKPDVIASEIKLRVSDAAGNTEDEDVIEDSVGKWTIEKNPPKFGAPVFKSGETTITGSLTNDLTLGETKKWYNQDDVKLYIDVNDKDSGLGSLMLTLSKDSVTTDSSKELVANDEDKKPNKTYTYNNGGNSFESGEYSLKLVATDNAGTQAGLNGNEGISFNIDNTNPEITVPNNPFKDWQTKEQELTFAVKDTTSGVYLGSEESFKVKLVKIADSSETEVNLSNEEPTDNKDGSYTYSFKTKGNGTYKVYASDNAQNDVSKEFTIFYIDTEAPGNVDLSIERGNNDVGKIEDWYQAPPDITITPAPEAEEGQSEVHTYYYVWNDGSEVKEDNAKEFISSIPEEDRQEFTASSSGQIVNPFTGDGNWKIIVWSQDDAGHIGVWGTGIKTGIVNLDREDPEIGLISHSPVEAVKNRETVTITVPVTEETGKLDENSINIADSKGKPVDFEITGQGNGKYEITVDVTENDTYTIIVTDESGRKKTETHVVDNIAPVTVTAPTIQLNGQTVSGDIEEWYKKGDNTDLTIIKAKDDTSTVKNITKYTIKNIKDPSAEVIEGTLPDSDLSDVFKYTLTDGIWKITAVTEREVFSDGGKITEDAKTTATIRVDETKAEIKYVSGNPEEWTMGPSSIIFSVQDATSGISENPGESIEITVLDLNDPSASGNIKFESVQGKEGQYKFNADRNGEYTITVTDIAGNTQSKRIDVTKIDNSPASEAKITGIKPGSGDDIAEENNDWTWYINEDLPMEITITAPKQHENTGDVTDRSPIETWYSWQDKDTADSEWGPETFNKMSGENQKLTISDDGIYRLKVYTWTEAAHNDSDASGKETGKSNVQEFRFYSDKTGPGITSAIAKPANFVDKVINFLNFGNFFNDSIKVTVTVDKNSEATSGPKTLYYYISEDDNGFTPDDNANTDTQGYVQFKGEKAEFIVPVGAFKDETPLYIKLYVKDEAGNLSELQFVKNEEGEGSSEWMLDNGHIEIDFASPDNGIMNTVTGYYENDHDQPWYNTDVTIKAEAVSNYSGLESVEGNYSGAKQGAEFGLSKDESNSKKDKTTSVQLKQTISAEGTTVFDIKAVDNAGNSKLLSENASFTDANARTIRLDKTRPKEALKTYIPDPAHDPDDEWVEDGWMYVYFTVSDHVENMKVRVDYSGVDPSTGKTKDSSVRVQIEKPDGTTEFIDVERIEPGGDGENYDNPLTNTLTFRFKAEENGTYKVYSRDYAGNESNVLEIPVACIPDGERPEAPVDGTLSEDPSKLVYGYVTYDKADGKNEYYVSDDMPEIKAVNSTDFVVNSGIADTVPVNTGYRFWNTSLENMPGNYETIGYTVPEKGDTPTAKEASITDILWESIEENGTADGIWRLHLINRNEGGKASDRVGWTFKIDTTEPVITAAIEDTLPWEQSKTIEFTVSDPNPGVDNATGGTRITGSGIDTSTIKVTHNGTDVGYTASSEGNGKYTFTATERGEYKISVSDLAGNPAKEHVITINYVSTEVPPLAGITVDPPAGNGGNVSDSGLNVPSYDQGARWYSTAVNNTPAKPKLSLTKPEEAEGAAPIVTHYEIWQGDTYDSSKVESGSIADNGGNGDWQENELSRIVKAITKDGQWNIRTWSVSESGVSTLPDPEDETGYNRRTVFVDNTAPAIDKEIVSIETVNDRPVEKLLNMLSFGIFFNEAIEVTVKVTDELSLGKDLHYTYERADGKESAEQTSPIKWNADDKTEGTAVISLPVGTKGRVNMWATDIAGNTSKSEVLTYMGTDHWEIENAAPNVLGTDPLDNENDVSVDIDSIDIIFDERIEANDEGAVSIISGGDRFTATPSDAKRIEIKPTDPQNTPEDSAEGVHMPWTASIDITEFKDSNGNPIELLGNFYYTVVIDGGAFKDLAGNSSNGETVSFHTSADIPLPVIGDIDVNLPQGAIMEPEDFSSDHNDYVILILDNALDSTKTHLENDLVMDVDMKGNVHVDEAVLTDIVGNVIAGADTDVLWQPDASGEGGRVVIPADKVEASENYFLKLRVSSHGAENTYSFFISTSAISATSEDVGSIGVTVDNDELLASMHDELQKDAIENWKVVLKFRAAAVPESSAGTELEAILKALETAEIRDSSLGYFPLDLSVTKTYARTGATDKVDKLNSPIDVHITLPEDSLGRELYGIYRYDPDTGAAVKVEHTLNADGTVATVSTDNFSGKFAVVYDAKPKSSGGGGSSGGSGGGPSGSGGSGAGTVTVSGTTAYYGGTWVNDGYLFIESDGNRPSNEWLRIDGKLYRFGLDGFRTTAYLQYKFNPDGSLNGDLPADVPVRDAAGTWLKDGWWYKTVSGVYLAGGWYYLFYQGRFEWYYFNADGWMLDGWLTLTDTPGDGGPADTSEVNPDGTPVQRTYYLHTTHDWTRGRMYTDWHFIDGKWYYFRTKPEGNEGSLVRNGITLTGHHVGPDGAWDGVGPTPTEAQ